MIVPVIRVSRCHSSAVAVLAALFFFLPPKVDAADFWELPPILYSDTPATDPISILAADLASGKNPLSGNTSLEKLAAILQLLEIPVESQVLVFSKTSHQSKLILPENPRALYFNENAYVGYVPGGSIEIITHDPTLGVVFHIIDPTQSDPSRIVERDSSACLACHGTRQTESVPGMLIRSVHPDKDGHLLSALGSSIVDSRTPLPHRWGGFFVTGHSTLPHLGNRTYDSTSVRGAVLVPEQLDDLSGKIDTSKYLRPTSDIVALMVLEHQCHMHNLLIAASLEYRRAVWMARSLDPQAAPDAGNAGRLADDHALRIVDALLYKNEADMGPEGVDGNPAFQDAFTRRFPRTPTGDSLADFHLGRRLFKNHCSYMIHSRAFAVLPDRVKTAVIKRLKAVLEDRAEAEGIIPPPSAKKPDFSKTKHLQERSINDFPNFQPAARQRTAAILKATVSGW